MPKPAVILAIDPGDVHVGLAWFKEDPATSAGWTCVLAQETTVEGMWERLASWMAAPAEAPDVLIYEKFQLYPDKAMAQTGSEMGTSQLIGVIKYTHWAALESRTVLIEQPASYQQTAQGLLRHRGSKSRAKLDGAGPHALSAELHGWAYIYRTNLAKDQ